MTLTREEYKQALYAIMVSPNKDDAELAHNDALAAFDALTAELAQARADLYNCGMHLSGAGKTIVEMSAELTKVREQYNWKHERAAEAYAQRDQALDELAQARAEIASLRGGWVKCADRLPELEDGLKHYSINVIGRDEHGVEYQAYCNIHSGDWTDCNNSDNNPNIIEWRLME